MDHATKMNRIEALARRQAHEWARDREARAEGWRAVPVTLVDALEPTFGRGRRLGPEAMARVSATVSDRLRELGSVYLAEDTVAPTRTRPQGHEREVLALLPIVRVTPGKGADSDLLSVRLHLTSRRAVIQSEFVGLRHTSHLHARAIERSICPPDEVEGEILRSMLDNAGLVALWRRAHSAGSIPANLAPSLAFRDGLIAGAFQEPGGRTCWRVASGADGTREVPYAGNALLVTTLDGRPAPLAFRASTAISHDMMGPGQDALWVALRQFGERHRKVLVAIGEASLWNDRIAPSPLRDLGREDVRGAVHDLVRIASNPTWRRQLEVKPGKASGILGAPPTGFPDDAPLPMAMGM